MIQFRKADTSEERFKLDFSNFLKNEGTGISVNEIVSFARVSGDVTLGIDARAPVLTDSGTALQFWLEGGTSGTRSLFEIQVRLSNTEEFAAEVQIIVTNANW
jgi:hypothetical protein